MGDNVAVVVENGSKEKKFNADADDESSFDILPEMDNLAEAIYRYSETTAPQLLGHVVVKMFLDLKWAKLK